MGQMSKVGRKATKVGVNKDKSIISVKYHQTEVVHVENNIVTLNNGGYLTVTTKARMNQTAMEFGLNFNVYQNKYDWFCRTPQGITVPFVGKTLSFIRG